MADINTCFVTPAQYATFLPEQIAQYHVESQEYVALKDPYSGVVDGGTFPSYQGAEVRTLVTGRPVMNQSQTRPSFMPWVNAGCNSCGPVSLPGNVVYTSTPQYLNGESEFMCLSEVYVKVRDTMMGYIENMKKGVFELNRNDTRIALHDLAGISFVARQFEGIGTLLQGGLNDVATPYNFSLGLPNANMSWEGLIAIMDYQRTVIRNLEYFPGGMFGGICSADQLEIFRNGAQLRTEQLAAIKGGGDQAGAQEAYWQYSWQEYAYRGVKFTWDEQPLRFNTIDLYGNPIFIDPEIPDPVSFGDSMTTNPAWLSALYEVMLLVTNNTLRKLIPENFTGEDGVVFKPQFWTGELKWINNPDMRDNKLGNMGLFFYQYVRAWEPVKPHGIVKIAYLRCQSNLNLLGCSNYPS